MTPGALPLTGRRFCVVLCWCAGLSALAVALAPFVGGEPLAIQDVLAPLTTGEETLASRIFLLHRLPRVLLGFLVGGSLAAAGAALQSLLANPLAEPYVLGVAGAGSLGAVAAITIPGLLFTLGPVASPQLFALVGCLGCVWLLHAAAEGPLSSSPASLLLAGVAVNVLCSAGILLVRYLANPHLLVAMDRWLMGGLDVVGFGSLPQMLPLLVLGLLLLALAAPGLTNMALGRDMAAGQGVDVRRVRGRALLGAGLCTAAAVSLAGPVGFVGLVAPHATRRFVGPDLRLLLPGSFCAGGVFLVACDAVARLAAAPAEMPVGIVTAFVGGPLFLVILWRHATHIQQ